MTQKIFIVLTSVPIDKQCSWSLIHLCHLMIELMQCALHGTALSDYSAGPEFSEVFSYGHTLGCPCNTSVLQPLLGIILFPGVIQNVNSYVLNHSKHRARPLRNYLSLIISECSIRSGNIGVLQVAPLN